VKYGLRQATYSVHQQNNLKERWCSEAKKVWQSHWSASQTVVCPPTSSKAMDHHIFTFLVTMDRCTSVTDKCLNTSN